MEESKFNDGLCGKRKKFQICLLVAQCGIGGKNGVSNTKVLLRQESHRKLKTLGVGVNVGGEPYLKWDKFIVLHICVQR